MLFNFTKIESVHLQMNILNKLTNIKSIHVAVFVNIQNMPCMIGGYNNNTVMPFGGDVNTWSQFVQLYRSQTLNSFVPIIDIEAAINKPGYAVLIKQNRRVTIIVNCHNNTFMQFRGARAVFRHCRATTDSKFCDLVAIPVYYINMSLQCKIPVYDIYHNKVTLLPQFIKAYKAAADVLPIPDKFKTSMINKVNTPIH